MADFNSLRERLIGSQGEGGIVVFGRALRLREEISNKALQPNEVFQILEQNGANLSVNEQAELSKVLGTTADDILPRLRGDDSAPGRRRVAERAWNALDRDGTGFVTVNELKRIFNAKRNPFVLQGKKSQEEVRFSFFSLFDNSDSVSFEDFLNYYAGVSATISNDIQFECLVNKAWRLGEPNATFRCSEADMAEDMQANFRTSNAIPTGTIPQHLPNAVEKKKAPRVMTTEIRPVLDPYVIPKVGNVQKGAAGSYSVTGKTQHKVKSLYNGDALNILYTTFSQVPDGGETTLLRETRTTAQELSTGAHNDDAIEAFRRGRAAELEHETRRTDILSQQYSSTAPPMYASSYGTTFTYLLPAVDRTVKDTGLQATKSRPRDNTQLSGATSPTSQASSKSSSTRPSKPLPWVGRVPDTTYASHFSVCDGASNPDEKDFLDTLKRRHAERVRETHGECPTEEHYKSVPRQADHSNHMSKLGNPLPKTTSRPLNVWDGTRVPNTYVTSTQLAQAPFMRDALMKVVS